MKGRNDKSNTLFMGMRRNPPSLQGKEEKEYYSTGESLSLKKKGKQWSDHQPGIGGTHDSILQMTFCVTTDYHGNGFTLQSKLSLAGMGICGVSEWDQSSVLGK